MFQEGVEVLSGTAEINVRIKLFASWNIPHKLPNQTARQLEIK